MKPTHKVTQTAVTFWLKAFLVIQGCFSRIQLKPVTWTSYQSIMECILPFFRYSFVKIWIFCCACFLFIMCQKKIIMNRYLSTFPSVNMGPFVTLCLKGNNLLSSLSFLSLQGDIVFFLLQLFVKSYWFSTRSCLPKYD